MQVLDIIAKTNLILPNRSDKISGVAENITINRMECDGSQNDINGFWPRESAALVLAYSGLKRKKQ